LCLSETTQFLFAFSMYKLHRMHTIEPHYNWRHLYIASEDERSPFYGYQNSEAFYTDHIYDHVIHPQWDNIGSETLFLKVLFADYDHGFAIIEFLGEWNDLLHNDIMTLKRDIIDAMIEEGIDKFILIVENVLNFHAGDTDYYEEWQDDLGDGWIAALNMREHVLAEVSRYGVDQYFVLGGTLNDIAWRSRKPKLLYEAVAAIVSRRLY
jgi:hypothetical protein